MAPALLDVAGLSKRFPGVLALDEVDLTLRRGQIHALVGENGAGKSSLMKILAGIYAKDSGTITLEGTSIAPASPRAALALGISSVHQELSLAPNLSVAENVLVGREPTRAGFVRRSALEETAAQLLEPFKVPLDPRAKVGSLSPAKQQIVEIARALASRPRILMLDEPTSSLETHEVEQLLEIVRRLAASGLGVLYVTHKLREVFQVAHQVTVLRDGRRVMSKPVSESCLDELVASMVGRELTQLFPSRRGPTSPPALLEAKGLCRAGAFHDISFRVASGEILGLAGLVGAGRSEVAQALFGHTVLDSGRIRLRGEAVKFASPRDAMQCGIAYLPEDRKAMGLFRGMSVKDNVIAASLDETSRWGFVSDKSARATTAVWAERLQVRTSSLDQPVSTLSGGNQQKVLLARWLVRRPSILIADEPTRGIDIGAKAEIHALLRKLADEGVGVILISSELPELLGLSDRILVLHEGKIAGELDGTTATEEALMRLATGTESAVTQAT